MTREANGTAPHAPVLRAGGFHDRRGPHQRRCLDCRGHVCPCAGPYGGHRRNGLGQNGVAECPEAAHRRARRSRAGAPRSAGAAGGRPFLPGRSWQGIRQGSRRGNRRSRRRRRGGRPPHQRPGPLARFVGRLAGIAEGACSNGGAKRGSVRPARASAPAFPCVPARVVG